MTAGGGIEYVLLMGSSSYDHLNNLGSVVMRRNMTKTITQSASPVQAAPTEGGVRAHNLNGRPGRADLATERPSSLAETFMQAFSAVQLRR